MAFLILQNPLISQNALDFDGANDYVQTKYPGVFSNNPRTIEVWVLTTDTNGLRTISDWGAPGARYTLLTVDGKISISIGSSSIRTGYFVADGNWHHIAYTYRDSAWYDFDLYLDGAHKLAFDLTSAVNTSDTGVDFRIGTREDNLFYWKGKIDEVRVWNVRRTSTQILNNYNKEICTYQPGLAAYFKFNQGIASGTNTVLDSLVNSVNSQENGELIGFSLAGSTSNWTTGKNLSADSFIDSISLEICDGDTIWIGNNYHTSNGVYIDSLTTIYGCDSTVFTSLTVKPGVLAGFNVNGNTLTAIQTGINYQWIDCNTKLPIPGENGMSFTPKINGFYALVAFNNGCYDTSTCYLMTGIGIDIQGGIKDVLSIYPNPSSGQLTVNYYQKNRAEIQVYSITKKLVFRQAIKNSNQNILLPDDLENGVYYVQVVSDENVLSTRLVLVR